MSARSPKIFIQKTSWVFLALSAMLMVVLILINAEVLVTSLIISSINLMLILYALRMKFFEHMVFKIFFAYHVLTMILPLFMVVTLYSAPDVLEYLVKKFSVMPNDILKGNIIILIYDSILIFAVVLFNKMNFFKKRKGKLFKYYLFDSNKYVLIIIIAFISYSMKLYLVSIGAWFMYEEFDLTQYPFANTAELLQKLDVLLLLFIAYNYKYDKSKFMFILMISIIIISLAFAIISTSKAKLFMILIPVVLLLINFKYKKMYLFGVMILFFSSGPIFDYFMYLRIHNSQSIETNTIEFLNSKKIANEKNIFDDKIILRLGYQMVVARAIRVYDNENFEYKMDYLNNIIGLVPRLLWPEKPVIGIDGNKIGHELGLLHRKDYQTSIGMSNIGEAFYELGYLGVFLVPIIVAFLLVYFSQILEEKFWLGFLLSIMFGLQIGVTDWYNTLLPGLIKSFIIFYFFGLLLNKKYTNEIKLKLKW